MHCSYDDIRERITEKPQWFDECAVPRYAAFEPRHVANIYAREVALVEIACQNCQTRFKVAFSRSSMDDVADLSAGRKRQRLSESIKNKSIHYGDPPNVGCCAPGATMNCDDLRVIEYWRRDKTTNHEWQRVGIFEIDVSEFDSATA